MRYLARGIAFEQLYHTPFMDPSKLYDYAFPENRTRSWENKEPRVGREKKQWGTCNSKLLKQVVLRGQRRLGRYLGCCPWSECVRAL